MLARSYEATLHAPFTRTHAGERAAFLEQVAPLRAAAPSTMRFMLATATLPQHIFAQLREVWPDLMPVFGPGLHRTAAGEACAGGLRARVWEGRCSS